jgi:tetratricopeptide (TPR) repeat protein
VGNAGADPRVRPAPTPFELGANAIDIESFLHDLEGPPPTAHATSQSVEVDLSIVLNDIKRPAPISAPDVESAFAQLREEAGRRSTAETADADYTRALVFRRAGDIDGCIAALRSAARAPRLQYAAASLLGQLFRERGEIDEAIEWLEQAAQAPVPGPAESHQVLYDLADALEAAGESTRALAVCLELQADAGPYRDVAVRIDRLTRIQAKG